MTRLNNHQLVQKLDDGIVIVDESAGEEVVIAHIDLPAAIAALQYFERAVDVERQTVDSSDG